MRPRVVVSRLVRMRDDRKGAPAEDLVRQSAHQLASTILRARGYVPADSGCDVRLRPCQPPSARNRPCLDSQYCRNVIACFTCFIRLRSGIANSHQNKPFPTAAADVHAITMQLWQHMVVRFTRRCQRRERRRQVPPCSREQERRADAIRRPGLLALRCRLTATPASQ
jgi:hypothetical protein